MANLDQKVREEVEWCIRRFGEFLGVEEYEMPEIVASDMNTSYAELDNARIYIHPEHYNNGIAYFEEVAHYFRDVLEPKVDGAVQEFFGRLGEEI